MAKQTFQQLLSGLYEAVLDSGDLGVFLKQLTQVVGGKSAIWLQSDVRGFAMMSCYNKTPEFIRRYQELLLHMDCSECYGIAHRGKACYTEDPFRIRLDMHHTDANSDIWMSDICCRISGGFVAPSGDIGVIAIDRGWQAGVFEYPDKAKGAVEMILPHIEQALRVAAAVGSASMQARALGRVIANRHQVFITFDVEGRVLGIRPNDVPVALGGGAVRIQDFGVEFAERHHAERYRLLLARVIAAGRCQNDGGGGAIVVPVAGAPASAVRICAMPYRASVGVPGRVCAIAMFSSGPAPALNPDLVGRLYGLSSIESRIASLLIDGLDVRAIADGLVIAERDVRRHLRAGLKKCGVKRQSELAQLLVSGPLVHLS